MPWQQPSSPPTSSDSPRQASTVVPQQSLSASYQCSCSEPQSQDHPPCAARSSTAPRERPAALACDPLGPISAGGSDTLRGVSARFLFLVASICCDRFSAGVAPMAAAFEADCGLDDLMSGGRPIRLVAVTVGCDDEAAAADAD
eukprot:CAMPEP_0178531866 /NCGR_PEP_ID=MMETSP0696-20121128/33671_1 /TAXON_ID=265572 /ORGANISM="Extubocellulus spinifer, Strain CCMP396" /LENGTH=143 /DNA_ID=CAMNT_0020163829 /DNA_START=138 /DNA_END=569 /DNA_ORIENTATION=-